MGAVWNSASSSPIYFCCEAEGRAKPWPPQPSPNLSLRFCPGARRHHFQRQQSGGCLGRLLGPGAAKFRTRPELFASINGDQLQLFDQLLGGDLVVSWPGGALVETCGVLVVSWWKPGGDLVTSWWLPWLKGAVCNSN